MIPLPRLWFFTDPVRTPDPVAVARRLPRDAVVVYRHFGAENAQEIAAALRGLRGRILLIGADEELAAAVHADGVHLPERLAHRAAHIKRRRPDWVVTVAAHSARALRDAAKADAAVLSPIFRSRSVSAGRALGIDRAAMLAAGARLPVIGLGGLTRLHARALMQRGFAGIAGVEMFASRSEAER